MEPRSVSVEATQDERILAALAHASVLLPFWGLIGAIVIWATQREKSRFVGFQALQGVVYQLILVLGSFLGFACYMCSFFGMFLLMPIGFFGVEGAAEPDITAVLLTMITSFLPFCILGLLVLVGFAFVLYGLYGAVRVLQGHDFRYVLIGPWLERYLSQGEAAA